MKSVAVALILAFGILQTVSFVQCCCGPLCSTPGELCKNHDHASRTEKPCTACGEHSSDHSSKSGKRPGRDQRCTHLGPTSELTLSQIADLVQLPPTEVIHVDLPGPVVDAPVQLPLRELVPRAGPERRPLYLLDSALLI